MDADWGSDPLPINSWADADRVYRQVGVVKPGGLGQVGRLVKMRLTSRVP